MSRIRQFFSGYHTIVVPQEAVAQLLDRLFQEGIGYRISKKKQKEGYRLRVSCRDVRALLVRDERSLDNCHVSEAQGLCRVLAALKKRLGVPLGVMLGAFLFLFLSSFVWEVRIEGLDGYNKDAVLLELERLGLSEGAFLPKTDLDKISAAYLSQSDLVGWMNITATGTVVTVSCRPYSIGELPPKNEEGIGANLIAAKDAVIEEVTVEQGRVAVAKGAVVKKGDLLVSGIYDNALGSKVVYAKGEVRGRVQKTLSVFVPYENTVESYASSRLTHVRVRIFGRTVCLFSRKSDPTEKVIESENRLYLFDRVRLPLSVHVSRACQSQTQTVRTSELEAVEIAYARMRTELSLLLCEGELLEKRVYAAFDENGYTLTYEIVYTENIAQTIEFSVK